MLAGFQSDHSDSKQANWQARLQYPLQGKGSSSVLDLINSMVNLILGQILPAVRAKVTKEILASTHVFVCTMDSTPRLVWSLADEEVSRFLAS
jgi:hypothetical protein